MWGKLVAVAFAVILFLLPCGAEDALLEEEYKNMMDSVPGDVAGLLPDGFFSEDMDEVHDAVKEVSGFGWIMKHAARLLGGSCSPRSYG